MLVGVSVRLSVRIKALVSHGIYAVAGAVLAWGISELLTYSTQKRLLMVCLSFSCSRQEWPCFRYFYQ
jgi:hypothetical protein